MNQFSIKTILFKLGTFPEVSETFIVNQLINAIDAGFEVMILVNTYKIENAKFYTKTFEDYNLRRRIVIEDYGVPKKRFDRIIKWLRLLWKNLGTLSYLLKFYKQRKKWKLYYLYQFHFYKRFMNIDIIHIQYGTNKDPVDILKSIGFLKAKTIVSFHGHDAFFPINGLIQQKGYYDALFEVADLVHVNTPFLERQLKKIGAKAERLKVVPIGVATGFSNKNKKRAPKEALRLLSIGRLDLIKGHHLAIEVIEKLNAKGADVTLSIVGEGSERETLENLITKNSLENRVFLLGRKSRDELKEILNDHDVLLFTSVSLSNGRAETQGLVIGEAQMAGLPVIAFDSGGVKYTFRDGYSGFLCGEKNTDEMVENVLMFIKNPHLVEEMGQKGIEYVKFYNDVKHIEYIWKTIYEDL